MKSELIYQWRKCGVNPGDVLLVHSSLKRVLRAHKVSPKEVMESFVEAVGPDGTVLFPLFNFDFTKGIPFDIRNTPSQMGVLTESARTHPNAVRSGHPIYSFAAIGANAHKFNVNNFSGYGPDSPFHVLRELNGKIGVLDLPDQHSMTFYHHVEEMNDVPYRFHKTFTGQYTDFDGTTTEREYGLFVRNLEKGVQTDVNAMGELLWDKGLYRGDRPGTDAGLRTISAREMYEAVSNVITSGDALGLLYSIEA
jgi:aminoglycoside 3-N-acetyltransferase